MSRDDATLLDILRAARLALEFRGRLIAGMRDRLLHGYDDVDLDLVWKTLDEDLSALVNRLEGVAPRRDP
jgi:uncharacterized protein with HEPN domain